MDAYGLALVYAWLLEHPEYYCSWVKSYVQLRWSSVDKRMLSCRVGGHWRRLADWATVLPALRCTAKFEVLATPKYLGTPLTAKRVRWDETNQMIPRKYRLWVFM